MAKEDSELSTPDPLTRLFPYAIVAYGWHIYSWWAGLLIGLLYVIVNIAFNFLYMATLLERSKDPIKGFQRIKWALFIITWFALGVLEVQ